MVKVTLLQLTERGTLRIKDTTPRVGVTRILMRVRLSDVLYKGQSTSAVNLTTVYLFSVHAHHGRVYVCGVTLF